MSAQEQKKLRALEINCFSVRNNGGYEDLLGQHQSEEALDEAGMHLFVEELADELEAYNEQLSDESKVDLSRKAAVKAAIRESRRVTYPKPQCSNERVLRKLDYLKSNDHYWDWLMNDEDKSYALAFEGESEAPVAMAN